MWRLRRECREGSRTLWRAERILRSAAQSLASLLSSITGEFFYSALLVYVRHYLLAYPSIMSLLPVIANLRGGLYSTLASRASTRLHLGYELRGLRDKWVLEQHTMIYMVKIIITIYVSFLATLASRGKVEFTELFYASFTALSLAHLAMLPLTVVFAKESFRRGWDPDHMLTPIVALLGDVTTVPTLLVAVIAYHKCGDYMCLLIPLSLLVINLYPVIGGLLGGKLKLKLGVAGEIGVSLALSVAIEVFTGILFVEHTEMLVGKPYVLGALPVLMQAGGGISSITASKMSTELHVGTYPPSFIPSRRILGFFLHNLIVYAPVYAVAGFIGFLSSLGATGLRLINLVSALRVSLEVGLILQPLTVLLSHALSTLAFKLGFDPDNTTIPVLTALMDISTAVLTVIVC